MRDLLFVGAFTGVLAATLALGCGGGGQGGSRGGASAAGSTTSPVSSGARSARTSSTASATSGSTASQPMTVTGSWFGSWKSSVTTAQVTILGKAYTQTVTPASGICVVTLVQDGSTLTGCATNTNGTFSIGEVSGTVQSGAISFGLVDGNGDPIDFSGALDPSGTSIEGTYQGSGNNTDNGTFQLSWIDTGAAYPSTTPVAPTGTDLTGKTWSGTFATTTGSGAQGNLTLFQVVQDQNGYVASDSTTVNGGAFTFGITNGSVATTPPVLVVGDTAGSGNALVLSIASLSSGSLSGTYSTVGSGAADQGTFTLTRH